MRFLWLTKTNDYLSRMRKALPFFFFLFHHINNTFQIVNLVQCFSGSSVDWWNVRMITNCKRVAAAGSQHAHCQLLVFLPPPSVCPESAVGWRDGDGHQPSSRLLLWTPGTGPQEGAPASVWYDSPEKNNAVFVKLQCTLSLHCRDNMLRKAFAPGVKNACFK